MNGNEGIQEQMMNMVQKLMEETQDIDIEELDKSDSDTIRKRYYGYKKTTRRIRKYV